MAIKVFKLITGEEIIGTIAEFDEYFSLSDKITDPIKFILTPDKNGKIILLMDKLIPMSSQNSVHIIKHTNIVYNYDPSKELEDAYKKYISSIVQPTITPLLI